MRIFVAYPYTFEGYRDALAAALDNHTLVYADEYVFNDHVLHKIEKMLAECDLALFDLTDSNWNVGLELGLAIGANHPFAILVSKEYANELKADIHGYDQVRYTDFHDLARGLKARIDNDKMPKRNATPIEIEPVDLSVSPIKSRQFRKVWLNTEALNPEPIFGMYVRPLSYKQQEHTLTPDDDMAMFYAEMRSRGQGLHGDLSSSNDFNTNSVLFTSGETGQTRRDGAPERPLEMIEVWTDGQIDIRFRLNTNHSLFQYMALLSTGYTLAQDTFMHFGLATKARFEVVLRLGAGLQIPGPKLPNSFEDSTIVDVKTQPFDEAFADLTMKVLRLSGAPERREVVLDLLARHDTNNMSMLPTNRSWDQNR